MIYYVEDAMKIEEIWKKKLAFWHIPFIILNVMALLFMESHTCLL